MRIAIVGAGMAGLACAERLTGAGFDIKLFDKGRGIGGRMSTRRVETAQGDASFDYGAQYFTARDPDFISAVTAWERTGYAARWPAAGDGAWVGTPGMNAPLKAMAAGLDIGWSIQVDSIEATAAGWQVIGPTIDDPILDGSIFDGLIIAVPAEQAAALLTPLDPAMARQASAVPSDPCWTVMAIFAEAVALTADVIRDVGALGWAARNSAKPGRQGPEAWVLQATPAWSRDHLEDDPAIVIHDLLAALADQIPVRLPETLTTAAHRWRYARTTARHDLTLWNNNTRLGCCGDWLGTARVESAWLSGRRLAEAIIPGAKP
jgi:predicted NAD/FAD-dependent oxidoreductase